MHKLILMCWAFFAITHAIAQPTHTVTDNEKEYKKLKDFIAREDYAFAYTLVKELKAQYPENDASDFTYIHDDINYYYVLCALKLMQPSAVEQAEDYIARINNEPRRQQMSFHLAHYYFLNKEYAKAVYYFNQSGVESLGNEQIADVKFEKAYAYFNLKQFEEAKPLFNEIHQLPSHKYYLPANYYYGFIAYYDKEYEEALKAFKVVETNPEYKGVVMYYITEIYYFRGEKEEALSYGEAALASHEVLYYDKQLKLLIGQLYFEKKNYEKALPLLEDYVNNTSKVSKEVLYELSYCYYMQNQDAKAIEGFKQLSNEKDSMGQNSMYLLGGLYLKTNQKENARNAFQYSAYNSSNGRQQQISRFTYAKLSYELGYQDVALKEMQSYLTDYPGSSYDTEAKEILVNLLTNSNNFKEALGLYESFPKPTAGMQKADPRILYGRAIEFINDQQLNKADVLFTKILSLPNAGPVLPYANYWKGEIAYRSGQFDAAIRYSNAFLQAQVPAQGEANNNTARYNLAYSWFQKENYTEAKNNFELITKSVSASSGSIEQDAYLRTADCYFMLRNFSQASAMYDKVMQAALPQSDYALYQKALIAGIKSGTEKIKLLNSLQKQYSASNLIQDANMEIAQTYIADEKFSDAVPYLDKILLSTNEGLKPKALLRKGLAYYNSNNNREALSSYQELIKKYPQSTEADEALTIIKDIYVEEGKPNDYVQLMKQMGKTVSATEAEELNYKAALQKYTAGNCDASIPALSNYIAAYPQGLHILEIYFYRSECYRAKNDWANAVKGYAYLNAAGLNKYYENATLEAGRISYFELKDYSAAKKYFQDLQKNTVNQDNLLEALRGLVRSYYLLKEYTQANEAAKELLAKKGINTDDKSIAYLVLGKSQQESGDCTAAITSFKSAAQINKSAWGAEARYELANCQFTTANYKAAEKSAMAVIKETGSYDLWVTKAYILLGDIFMKQKDYFNAKATFESVYKNAAIQDLRDEAKRKLDNAFEVEKQESKIN
ncbi:MAG: hypothetical protein ABS68_10265 [Niastella sp. SCN 39-18]|nr:MAG: hypothetical protein ABS68_10265 [Niastella sp. SCN 39-18]